MFFVNIANIHTEEALLLKNRKNRQYVSQKYVFL